MRLKTPTSTPALTLTAKSQGALINAASKKAAALSTATADKVLVVYGDRAAALFCEPQPPPLPQPLRRPPFERPA